MGFESIANNKKLVFGETLMSLDESDSSKDIIPQKSSFPLNPLLAIIFTCISSFIIVFLIMSIFDYLARQEPSFSNLPVIWPALIYAGAVLGSLLGGIIAYWEIWRWISDEIAFSPGKLASVDLAYVFGLLILTYILEVFSESIILQGIMFLLELALFMVWGRNIVKIIVEIPQKRKDPHESSESAVNLEI